MALVNLNKPAPTNTRMDKIPARALLRVGKVMHEGMKYETTTPDRWRNDPPEEHLERALRHVRLHQAGDTGEDHAGHAATRMLMWLEGLAEERR